MSESETTSASNWKVIRGDEAGRRGARWEKVTFTLDFSLLWAVKGLNLRGLNDVSLHKLNYH